MMCGLSENVGVVSPTIKKESSRWNEKLNYLKQLIREYVHENAAFLDELEELESKIIMKEEERKYLLKKLREYEPQIFSDLHVFPKGHSNQTQGVNRKKSRRKKSPFPGEKGNAPKNFKPEKKNVQSVLLDNVKLSTPAS